jgi:hypothetical protein
MLFLERETVRQKYRYLGGAFGGTRGEKVLEHERNGGMATLVGVLLLPGVLCKLCKLCSNLSLLLSISAYVFGCAVAATTAVTTRGHCIRREQRYLESNGGSFVERCGSWMRRQRWELRTRARRIRSQFGHATRAGREIVELSLAEPLALAHVVGPWDMRFHVLLSVPLLPTLAKGALHFSASYCRFCTTRASIHLSSRVDTYRALALTL